jgi:hypothetical protein
MAVYAYTHTSYIVHSTGTVHFTYGTCKLIAVINKLSTGTYQHTSFTMLYEYADDSITDGGRLYQTD